MTNEQKLHQFSIALRNLPEAASLPGPLRAAVAALTAAHAGMAEEETAEFHYESCRFASFPAWKDISVKVQASRVEAIRAEAIRVRGTR